MEGLRRIDRARDHNIVSRGRNVNRLVADRMLARRRRDGTGGRAWMTVGTSREPWRAAPGLDWKRSDRGAYTLFTLRPTRLPTFDVQHALPT